MKLLKTTFTTLSLQITKAKNMYTVLAEQNLTEVKQRTGFNCFDVWLKNWGNVGTFFYFQNKLHKILKFYKEGFYWVTKENSTQCIKDF